MVAKKSPLSDIKINLTAFLSTTCLTYLLQNSLLPPSQRCKDQTSKAPTGPYQRDKLLNFLEETAKKEEDWQEHVPFNPGVIRGKHSFKLCICFTD